MKKKLLLMFVFGIVSIIQAQEKNNAIVLELFTSQGCSSCPPADELLDKIKKEYKNENVYVLSYHVDYWNRLGWKDPFSKAEFTNYQNQYANEFYSRSVYTPQLIVNGSEHFVGSNGIKTQNALKKYSTSRTSNTIEFKNIEKGNEEIFIEYAIEGENYDKLTVALVIDERVTKIGRGENRNRTLKNTNIVAERVILSSKEDEKKAKIKIPTWIKPSDKLSIIAFTQDQNLKTTGVTATVL